MLTRKCTRTLSLFTPPPRLCDTACVLGNISYIYTVTGSKVAMLKGMGVHSYYAGGFVYKANKTLDYILHAEGVIRATDATGGQTLGVEYFLRDHLGNTRVVFNSSGAVLQTTDYYPFGKEHTPLPISNGNRYLYNGKEKQEFKLSSSSLDWYDYGRRFYDPQLGRFTTLDPLAEKNHSQSGFVYAANNPIKYIDYMGLDSVQRASAVAMAKEYVQKNTGNTYPTQADIDNGDFRGGPGEKVDCSGLVSNCMMKSEEPDPYTGKSGNGVSRIVQSSEKVTDKNDIEVGNAITLDNSKSGKDNPMGHIGIIVEVKKNDEGEVIGYIIVHSGGNPSTGKSGPRYTNITLGGKGYWDSRVTGIYKWDKKPDVYNAGTLKPVNVYGKGNTYLNPISTVKLN